MSGRSLPSMIGRFQIESLLGSGGMGEVYKAYDPKLKRLVAVKIVRADQNHADFVHRMRREAEACARLQHPHIVTIHEAGDLDDGVFIVMEYLKGEDLSTVLGRDALTFETKLGLLVQVLGALAYAHAQGVIHRDVKPGNVHVLPDGSIKLLDFGLARVQRTETLTVTGWTLGTLNYASPEQLRGERVDERTDVYSSGAMAYHMLAGCVPFASKESPVETLLSVLSDPPPPINTVWTKRFPAIEQIIMRALAKTPADRYQSAGEMRDAVVAFLQGSRDAIAAANAEFARASEETVLESPQEPAADLNAAVAALVARVRDELNATDPASVLEQVNQTPAANASGPPPPAPVSRQPVPRARWWIAGGAAAVTVLSASLATYPWWNGRRPSATAADQTKPSGDQGPEVVAGDPGAPVEDDAKTEAVNSSTGPAASDGGSVPVNGGGDREGGNNAPPPVVKTPPEVLVSNPVEAPLSARQLFVQPPIVDRESNAGLRYRVVKRLASGEEVDVSTETVFYSGDRIRLAFDSNIDGYLYVFYQGSSGRWDVLFPRPDINEGKNSIRRLEEYGVPPGGTFRFDDTPGVESVFVLLARDPLPDLPGFAAPVTGVATLSDTVVDSLKGTVRSRDLIVERDQPGVGKSGRSMLATYIVNRQQQAGEVGASLFLKHAAR